MSRAKILMLAHRVPWPADKGDRLRSNAILRYLTQRHDVWLGTLDDDRDAAHARKSVEALREMCAGVCVVRRPGRLRGVRALWTGRAISCEIFASAELDRWIAKTTAEHSFDAALGYSGQMAEPLFRVRSQRRFLDLCDVDSAKWAARFRATRNPVYWLEARRVAALERRALREFDGVSVVTQREADILGGEGGRLHVIPLGVDLSEFSMRERDPGGAAIGFVGAMDYAPNAEGASWFAREVLPIVHRTHPDATFVVIGRDPPAGLASLRGVTTTGWVEDIRPHLAKCAVGVVPIRTSHGVQTKAIVSMALGLPQVVTAAALGGLDADGGREVLAADRPEDFARAVTSLLDSPAERARISAAGRAFAERRCDWSRILAPLEEVLLPGATGSSRPVAVGRTA